MRKYRCSTVSSSADMQSLAVVLIAFKIVFAMSVYEPMTSLRDLESDDLDLIQEEVAVTRVRRQDVSVSTDSTVFDPNATPTPSLDPNATPTLDPNTTQPATPTPPAILWPGTVGFECSTELYKRYSSKCCPIPALLDNRMINRCNTINKIPISVQRGTKYLNIQFKGAVRAAKKSPSILATIDQICLAHCIFKNERWLNKDNQVDENFFYGALSVIVPSFYIDLLNKARTECSQTVSTGDVFANVTNYFGKRCFLTPSKILRCIKRFMMIECLAVQNSGRQCSLDLNTLKACDPMLL